MLTELEDAAGRAWELMFSWAMPAGIALDFAQEAADGDRARALEALKMAALDALANARPNRSNGSFCDVEAGAFSGELLGARFDRAQTVLTALKHRLFQIEFISTSPDGFVSSWLAWCERAERSLKLCCDLQAAANPVPTEDVP